MSDFTDNLCIFLRECRNDVLDEICGNEAYMDYRASSLEIYDRLQESVPPEYSMLVNEYIDNLSEKAGIEISYCYLCGMRDGSKEDIEFNPTAKDTPQELAEFERYAALKSKIEAQRKELNLSLNTLCLNLLDDYIAAKNITTGVEKTYCYPGGLRDKVRLDKQFDPSFENIWRELMDSFL